MNHEEIAEFCTDCILENIEGTCDHCKETNLYVREFDITYRNQGAKEPHMLPLCIGCYKEYIVDPMDDLWADYNAGRL